jgi:hypothetical protein
METLNQESLTTGFPLESFEVASHMDDIDPLASLREEYYFPPRRGDPSKKSLYMSGNAIGLLSKKSEAYV